MEPCLSHRDCTIDRRDLVSSVSRRRGIESGLPLRFDRALLVDRGVVFTGNRALAMAGEDDMVSSSGGGDKEAFLFRDEDGVDTTGSSVGVHIVHGCLRL